ncbi:chemotaxis response regulator protein-glutamate methylesterase [Hydrogenophaga sp.]|uniref:protein-glutamate methylesterase/protein-glutamine glutaminase n=1 Tax=Hydrogenophaga sp. TaxID=1904254 RepID=UPI003569DDE9
MSKIRVVVIDDSALVRTMLTAIINGQPDMVCVGTAGDPLIARDLIRELNPDVLTLDVEMPRMDGIEFLSRLMRLRPMPVLMVSTLTEHGADVTLRALELGAVDFVAKPRVGVSQGLHELAQDITDKIRIASKAKVKRLPPKPGATDSRFPDTRFSDSKFNDSRFADSRIQEDPAHRKPADPKSAPPLLSTEKMVFIGASTGGTEALREILSQMPADSPAIAIAQHMPAGFTASFATRLDGICRIRVKEAQDGERMLLGHAYIAPGGRHLRIERSGSNYVAIVEDTDPVNRHRPSVEVLFRSAARVLGPNATGIMLTGMGADGALAMRQMKDAGSYNYVQDEASCVVFGMPRVAIECGAAHEVLPLTQIAPALLKRMARNKDGVYHRI